MLSAEQESALRQDCRQVGTQEVRTRIASGRYNGSKVAIMVAELENMLEDERQEHERSMQSVARRAAFAAKAGALAAAVSAIAAVISVLCRA